MDNPKQVVIPTADHFNKCRAFVSVLRGRGLDRSGINALLPDDCRIPSQARAPFWNALVYGKARFPKNSRGTKWETLAWDKLAVALEAICNGEETTIELSNDLTDMSNHPAAKSPAVEKAPTRPAERIYHPIEAATLNTRLNDTWREHGAWLFKPVLTLKEAGKPKRATGPARPNGLALAGWAVTHFLNVAVFYVLMTAWYPWMFAKITWMGTYVIGRLPFAVIHGLLSSLSAMFKVMIYGLRLSDLPGHAVCCVYSNEGHSFRWLPLQELDTHVRRKKKFGFETWIRTNVPMATVELLADGRVVAFNPDPETVMSTPENHFMALEEPVITQGFMPNAEKRKWNEVIKFGLIAVMIGVVVGGIVLISVSMIDQSRKQNMEPVLDQNGILITPTPFPIEPRR